MAYGFPIETPEAGSAEGYIGEDGHFYGVLHIGKIRHSILSAIFLEIDFMDSALISAKPEY